VVLRNNSKPAAHLWSAVLGGLGLILIGLLPVHAPAPLALLGGMLAVWLCAASLIAYRSRFVLAGQQPASSIPLRFSGSMGRFILRRRGDGRHVQVISNLGAVLADVQATDLQDRIDVCHGIGSDEVEALGSALGQAIALVTDAEEAHLDWDDHADELQDMAMTPAHSNRW